MVEFLMNDKNGNGRVSVEEAMQILFLRYGRQKMDEMLQEIFGTSDIHRCAPPPCAWPAASPSARPLCLQLNYIASRSRII